MKVEAHWERCLRVLQRHQPSLRSWTWAAAPDGLRLDLVLGEPEDPGPVAHAVRLEPPGDGPAWFRAPSCRVVLAGPAPPGGLPPALEALRALVLRADPGGLTWSLPAPPPRAAHQDGGRGPDWRPAPQEVPGAREELAAELHWASFLAVQSVCHQDLYPHVHPLGELVDAETVLGFWRTAADRHREGSAPEKLGLYVHIPFCTVACTFCYCGKTDDFRRPHVQRYVDDLCAEAALYQPILADLPLTSAYFGGGTPSLLTPPQMRQLFGALWGGFSLPAGTQVIYEGNPDSLSDTKIAVLAGEGRVTRLTIGVQTLDDGVQALVKRFNTPAHVADAVRSARRHGIPHVNLDLMAGLPGQTVESFLSDLEFLLSCEPDSIHLNAWRPLPHTSLAQDLADPMTPERMALRDEMMARAEARLDAAGHHTLADTCRRRTANAANLQEYDLRRQNSSLVGLGVPARSHAFGSAYVQPEMARGWEQVRTPEPLLARRYRAVRSDTREEQHKYLVSNLRTGFDRAEYRGLFGCDVMDDHAVALEKLAALGAVVVTDDAVDSHTGSHADDLVYRGLLYSQVHDHQARRVWGGIYDPDADYRARLAQLVQG